MRTALKLAAVLAAVTLVLGAPARAQAGGIVFWSGGTRIIATSRPMVVPCAPMVVPAPRASYVIRESYRDGYRVGYVAGYNDGVGATYITGRTVLSVPTYMPTPMYCLPRVTVYTTPIYAPRYMRRPPMHVFGRRPHHRGGSRR